MVVCIVSGIMCGSGIGCLVPAVLEFTSWIEGFAGPSSFVGWLVVSGVLIGASQLLIRI